MRSWKGGRRKLSAAGFLFISIWSWLALDAIQARADALPPSSSARAQLQAREQSLFEQILGNPTDVDLILAFADVAVKLGDDEAAVTALERLLLFKPDLARANLELGTLYFRMGAYELARVYYARAEAANAPADVALRAGEFSGEATKAASPGKLAGYVFTGVQYQSDANVAPASPLVQNPIGELLLGNDFVKRNDFSIFGSAAALYSYDLGTQTGDTIEVLGTSYVSHYFRVNPFDIAFAEVTAGPRFNFPEPAPGIATVSVKPYVIVNNVLLGENEYFDTYGAGLEARALVGSDISVKGVTEIRRKNFSNSNTFSATGLNGSDTLVSLQASKPITLIPNSQLSGEFDFLNQRTRLAYFANKSYGATLAYRVRYLDPTRLSSMAWGTTFLVSHIWSNYAAPDPCCDTSSTPGIVSPSDRYDRHWRFAVSHIVPLTDRIDLVVQVQRDVVSSNLPLYAYTSNSVLVGPKVRF